MNLQMTSIPASEQKAFIGNFLLMLRVCEKSADRDHDAVLKNWVEGACRIWFRITGEKIDPKWVKSEAGEFSLGLNLEKIARKEQADALHMYWLLVSSCDSEADNQQDDELKPKIVDWYEQWNRITGSENQPRWIARSKHKEKTT